MKDHTIIQDLSTPPLIDVEGLEPRPLDRAMSFTDEAVSILTSTSQLAQSLLGRTSVLKLKESLAHTNTHDMSGSSCEDDNGNMVCRKREFIPEEKKDEGYWDKRRKNNEAAKRSREKRRANDVVLETRVLGLLQENARLRAELLALKFRFGLVKETSDVTILPLSGPACIQPTPSKTHCYQPQSDGSSYLKSQSSTSTHHIQPHPQQQGAVYGLRGAGVPSGSSVGGICEESGFSTTGSSHVGSPVFFGDGLNEHSRPSARGVVEEQQGYDSHPSTSEVNEGSYAMRQDSGEGLRSLPHKLRFKAPGGGSDGGDVSLYPDSRHSSPPVATVGPHVQPRNHRQAGWDGRVEGRAPWPREEACGGPEQQYQSSSSGYHNSTPPQSSRDPKYMMENSLRSQISCLSQEVTQLKKLFSQQLLPKLT
ncbi:uncharacterized protein ACN63O_011090 [Diretmus argenteus]